MHLLEDWLKKAIEEVDDKEALKQVAESTLQEKTCEVTLAKRKLAVANCKLGVLMGKLEESDTKLAQALSVVTARDTKLRAMKKKLVEATQTYYGLGFDDTKCSAARVIKEARLAGSVQVPLPDILLNEEVRQEGEAGEVGDNPSFQDLLEKIEAFIAIADVIIVENPNPPVLA